MQAESPNARPPAPSAPFRPPSNHQSRDTLLFSASLPQQCHLEARLKSCSYFTVKPLRGARPGPRRCLLFLSLSFIPSTRALISDFKLELDFAKHLQPSPRILGFRFMSLEDTTFEADFAGALNRSPTVLGSAWHNNFYEHLLVGPGDLKRKIGQKTTHSWGERRHPAHLIIRGDGFTGGPVGVAQTLPICILLEVPSALPENLLADCTLTCRVNDMARRGSDGDYAATTIGQQIPDLRLAHGPELAVCSEDPAYYMPLGEREHATRTEAPASKKHCRRLRNTAVRFISCIQDPSIPQNMIVDRHMKASSAPRAAAASPAISNARQSTDVTTGNVTSSTSVHVPQETFSSITAISEPPLRAGPDATQLVPTAAPRRPPSPTPTPLPEGYRLEDFPDPFTRVRKAVAFYLSSPGNGSSKGGLIRLHHCMRNDWTSHDLESYGTTWDEIATYLDHVNAMTVVDEDRGSRHYDPSKPTKSSPTSPLQPPSAKVSSDSKPKGSKSGLTWQDKGKWVPPGERGSIACFTRPQADSDEDLAPEVLATTAAFPLNHNEPISGSSVEAHTHQKPAIVVHAVGYGELLTGTLPAPSDSSTRSLHRAKTDRSWSETPAQQR